MRGVYSPESVARGDAEAGAVVVEDGEQGSLPLKRGVDGTDEANDGGDEENDTVEVVELGEKVAPGHGGPRLCGLEGVLDIVVGDVEIDGDDLLDVGGDHGRRGGGGEEREGGGGEEKRKGGGKERKGRGRGRRGGRGTGGRVGKGGGRGKRRGGGERGRGGCLLEGGRCFLCA